MIFWTFFTKLYISFKVMQYTSAEIQIPQMGLKLKFYPKISKNMTFSLNKVRKMSNKIFFSTKYEMSTAYGFRIGFQFWDQKSLSRDLQMDMSSHWHLKWASTLAMVLFGPDFFFKQSLCIDPYVNTCAFGLRPTYFLKNQSSL